MPNPPRYDYGLPNDQQTLTTWATQVQNQLRRMGQQQGPVDFEGIKTDFRVIEGEFGNFVRFKFETKQPGASIGGQWRKGRTEQLFWDLVPGAKTDQGMTFATYHQSGALTGIGSEGWIGREVVDDKERLNVQFSDPTEALARYVSLSLKDEQLSTIYPNDPRKRLGLLLYKGAELGLGVAGGMPGYNVYHSEQFINKMSESIAVGIHPDIMNREGALQAVYNTINSFAVQSPQDPWARLQEYFPTKTNSQNVIRLHNVRAAQLLGDAGLGNLSMVAISNEAKSAIESAPQEFLKRRRYAGFEREQAELMGYKSDIGHHIIQPGEITGPESRQGYRRLTYIPSGMESRPAVYVQPNWAFTGATPFSGLGILYGKEKFPEEAISTGQISHHEVALPKIPIQEIPSMEMEFGVFERGEEEGKTVYTKKRGLKGFELEPRQSAIIGVMKYMVDGEQYMQEIGYTAGATPHTFLDDPTLIIPTEYDVATGEGHGGLTGPPYAAESGPIAKAAQRKFGIKSYASGTGASTAYLNFPTVFGTHSGIKGGGHKVLLQPLETTTGTPAYSIKPEVPLLGGGAAQAEGVSELKGSLRTDAFAAGVFGTAWPSLQVEMIQEIARAPGATKRQKQMVSALTTYIKGAELQGVKIREDKLAQIYNQYMGVSGGSGAWFLFDMMRKAVERPGYESVAFQKYGHAKFDPAWFEYALTGEAGYEAIARYGKPGKDVQFDMTKTGGVPEPLGEGPLGYLRYKMSGVMSVFAGPLVPEYVSNQPMLGYEERFALEMLYPEAAEIMGTNLGAGRTGILESGFGYEAPEMEGWRQIHNLARVLQQNKGDIGKRQRPVGSIELTRELADRLAAALSETTPRGINLGALEEIISEVYGEGEQLMWNPKTKKAMVRPKSIAVTATAKYPEDTPYWNQISMLASSYPYALEEWIDEFDNPPGEFGRIQEESGLLKTSLQSFYRDINSIFASQSRNIEKSLQSLTSAGIIGGRYGFSLAAGVKGAVVNQQGARALQLNLGHQAGLMGDDFRSYMQISSQQLREGPIPSLFWRFPGILKPGGLIPTNLVTSDFLRRQGVHIPEGRSVVGGQVSDGSVFTTNMPFMIGLQWLPHVGDLDLDPGQLMALARATPAGLVTPQDPRLISALASPDRRTVNEWLTTLGQAFGTKGNVAGGRFNILAEAMNDIAARGGAWGTRVKGSDPFEPIAVDVPRQMWWAAGTKDLGSYLGMGMEYNMRRLFEASAGMLGFSGEAMGIGQTSAALRYQEFLDKLANMMKTTTTLTYSSFFGPDKATGEWRLMGLMGQQGKWTKLMQAGKMGGQGSWHTMMRGMATALQADITQQIKEGELDAFNYQYPAYLLAQREEDIPVLASLIEGQPGPQGIQTTGGVYAGLMKYAELYKGWTGNDYDPTKTVLGLSIMASAVSKGYGWGEKRERPRHVETQKSTGTLLEPTFESDIFSEQNIMFEGELRKLSTLPYSETMQGIEGMYGYLTRKYPVTPIQSGILYGHGLDLVQSGRDIPPPVSAILGRYPAQQEALAIAQAEADATLGIARLDRPYHLMQVAQTAQPTDFYTPYIMQKSISMQTSTGEMRELYRKVIEGKHLESPPTTGTHGVRPFFRDIPYDPIRPAGQNPQLPLFPLPPKIRRPPGTGSAATGAPAFPEDENASYGSMGRYLVGESGPEIITFNTPASIYPANMTRANALGMKPQMGDWATNQVRGAATGISGIPYGGLPLDQLQAALRNAPLQGAQPAQAMPWFDPYSNPAHLAGLIRLNTPQITSEMIENAITLKMEYIRGTPSDKAQNILTKLGAGLAGIEALKSSQTNLVGMLSQATGIDLASQTAGGVTAEHMPEAMVIQAIASGDTSGVMNLYKENKAEITALAAQHRKASAIQYAINRDEIMNYLPAGSPALAELEQFYEQPGPGTSSEAQLRGRAASIIESFAKIEERRTGGGGASRGRLANLVGDIPDISLEKFAKVVEEATVQVDKFQKTIDKFGEESPQGLAARQGIQRAEGRIRAAEAQMMLPVAYDAFEAAQQAYAADPSSANALNMVQAGRDVRSFQTQYRTGTAAATQGRWGAQAASRFTRGLIGGWGLMYMGHLLQFPMGTAQYGFAEAEAYQQQMASAAGGIYGPSISPVPSVSMRMLQSQIEYGGQGFGAYQNFQANLPPLARDIQGTAMAAAAGGALGLYGASVATGAGLGQLAGWFTAAAPWAALGAAVGYGALQVNAWQQQPQQTMVSSVLGYLGGGQDPTPGIGGQRRTLTEGLSLAGGYIREWAAMSPQQKQQRRLLTEAFRLFESGQAPFSVSGPPNQSALRMIPTEMLPQAAQIFAGRLPEGYDPNIGGQTFLDLQGIYGAADEREAILADIWAQQRGINTGGIAESLISSARMRMTRQDVAELRREIVRNVPDKYVASEVLKGAEVAASLPAQLVRRLSAGQSLIDSRLELAEWTRSDYFGMLQQEGALDISYGTLGLGRPQPSVSLLSRIRQGRATRQEMRGLTMQQLTQQQAAQVSQQIGMYDESLMTGVNQAYLAATPQQREYYKQAAQLMPQAAALGIGESTFLGQVAGRGVQGNLLAQQALGLTKTYALWGGQDTQQFFTWSGASLENQVFAQRLMSFDPLAFADAAAQGMPGASQFAQTVDVGLGGQLTGMSWGTTSLASVGVSAAANAQSIFGNQGIGSGWRNAAVQGYTTPFGKTWGGTRGLGWYMRGLQWEAQQASMGSAMAQIALQEEYMPKFWDVQDRQRALQHEQALWGFDMQQRQFAMQGTQFQENMGLQRRGQLMQRGWAMEDWAFQDKTRALQWGWKQEDFAESVRFMTGRQRKLAERQMERETIMYGIEGERIDTQRERQKEQWSLEDQRFELTKKHFQEQRQLQEENMKKQREFYDEGKKLQDEMIKLQREYQLKQLELQKAAIGAQAEAAKKMKEAQDAMQAIAEEAADRAGEFNLAKSRQVDMINTIVKGMNHLITNIPGVFVAMGKALIPLFKSGGGAGGGGGPNDYYQTGGPTMPGELSFVGESGIEAIRSSVPQHVFPTNETFAAVMGGNDKLISPWEETIISNMKDSTGGTQRPTTIIVNIGNERLGEFVLNTVNDALEVR